MFSLVLPYRFHMDLPMPCHVNFIDETAVISSGNPPDSCEVFMGLLMFARLLSCVGCVASAFAWAPCRACGWAVAGLNIVYSLFIVGRGIVLAEGIG